MRLHPRPVLATALLVSALALVGCSSSSEPAVHQEQSSSSGSTGLQVEVTADTTVLDVRTAEEFAQGHLEGAVNIDVTAPGFGESVADLPTDAPVVVYCRSGNRSAAAASQLAALGFSTVVDAGGLDAAAEQTGLAVVTD